jgi:hypothetical protein
MYATAVGLQTNVDTAIDASSSKPDVSMACGRGRVRFSWPAELRQPAEWTRAWRPTRKRQPVMQAIGASATDDQWLSHGHKGCSH